MKKVIQIQIGDLLVDEFVINPSDFTVFFHAPFNFFFTKNKTKEVITFFEKMKNSSNESSNPNEFFFIIHYKNPYTKFLKEVNAFINDVSSVLKPSQILIENSAYHTLSFEQFSDLPLNFCLDTCHLYASGIDLKDFLTVFKRRIKAIHLNDYTGEFGSKKDRHANLFAGNVFSSPLHKKILFETILSGKYPVILETPDQSFDYDKLVKSLKSDRKSFDTNFLGMTFVLYSLNRNLNKKITDYLEKEIEKVKGSKTEPITFKKRALERGVSIIRGLPFVITDSSQLDGIDGIGEGIKERVDKVLKKKGNSLFKRVKSSVVPEKIQREFIKENFEKKFKKIGGVITGSYRRGNPDSSDVDILVVDKEIDEVIEFIKENYDLKKIISAGEKKASVIVSVEDGNKKVQLDIVKTTADSYAAALLYFTGSKYFNIEMRKKAKELGYKLNEYGLFLGDKKLKTKTEKDIFDILKIEYKKPSERD